MTDDEVMPTTDASVGFIVTAATLKVDLLLVVAPGFVDETTEVGDETLGKIGANVTCVPWILVDWGPGVAFTNDTLSVGKELFSK